MQLRLALLFSILLSAFSFAVTLSDAHLDLSAISNPHKANPIHGDTRFYWKKHATVEDIKSIQEDAVLRIPGIWNGIEVDSMPIHEVGYATFAFSISAPDSLKKSLALSIPVIFSSYRLYLDSTLLTQCGDPQKRPETTIADYLTQVVEFDLQSDTSWLIFQVSNYTNDKGGPWHPIYIGSRKEIHRISELHFSYDVFLIGALFAFTLAYLFMSFIENKKLPRQIPLYFGLYALTTLLRLMVTSNAIVFKFFPQVPTSIFTHIEYMALFLAPLFYHSYIHYIYAPYPSEKLLIVLRYFFYILTGFSLLTPQLIHSRTIPIVQIASLLLLLYHIYLAIRTYKNDQAKAMVLVISTVLLIGAIINDILQVYSSGFLLPLLPLSSVVIAMLQSYFVSKNSAQIQNERIHYAQRLESTNGTLSRFVPQKFFHILNKTPTTIHLGDQTNRKMSVLFCDIRNLEELSAGLNSDEKFAMISNFLDHISKIIVTYGGVIDKFIGDSLMAIFPEQPENALQASFEIISSFYEAEDSSLSQIRPGIGIHYGMMTLGVIGTDDRMENTVIGDAVNTAARMRSLTHKFNTDLIVSNEVLNSGFAENDFFHIRSLGTLAVKGKRERTTIQEIFYVENSNEVSKLDSRNYFEQAIVFYEVERYMEAETLFQSALDLYPHDLTAKSFVYSCRHNGVPILTTK